eukprot:scaffold101343_cov67-Attheya_sp.AAC.1
MIVNDERYEPHRRYATRKMDEEEDNGRCGHVWMLMDDDDGHSDVPSITVLSAPLLPHAPLGCGRGNDR